jgi:hypothetical protein
MYFKNKVLLKVHITTELGRQQGVDFRDFEKSIGLKYTDVFESEKCKKHLITSHYYVYEITDPEKYLLFKLKYAEEVAKLSEIPVI